jgi:hypothetical protein
MKFSNNSICVYLALLLLSTFVQVSLATTQAAWYKLTGPDEDFDIEFPSLPIYEEVPVPSIGERLQTYRFAYGNNYFSLKYVDLRLPSAAAKAAAAVRLEEYARDYTKTIIDAGGQVLTRTPLADGGTEFVSKYPVGESRGTAYEQSRVYFRGTRRYVLSCTSLSASGIDQAFARRFFSSFRLRGTPMPGAEDKHANKPASNSPAGNPADATWYRFTSPDGDFEAEFPDKPHYETNAHPVTGSQMQSVSFHYGEYDLSVQISELVSPLTTRAERERWFDGAAERFVRGSESRLIRQTRLADGALQIESEREINGRRLFIRARAYARGSRAYVVSCSVFGQSLSALDEPLPARFFASFRLK